MPYNPLLCMLFHCHINLEIVSTIQAVNYIYKYVYKGSDRVLVALRRDGQTEDRSTSMDEIALFQDGR